MQEQRSSDNHPLFPKANNNAAIPMPGTPPPAPYPYLPPSIPNGSVPMQYAPPSVPNGPVQYPSASPYQQQYPAYATSSANTGIGQISLIGGAIACGIDTLLTLLITFVPA